MSAEDGARLGRPRARSAFFLSLLCPGLGHFAVGRFWPRGVIGVVAALGLTVWQATAVALDRPWAATALFAASWLTRFAIAADAWWIRRPPTLPAWSNVGFVAAGLGLLLYVSNAARQLRLAEALHVRGGSMYPTVLEGDHVYVSKVGRRARRGDVVAFRAPNDGRVYLKRVIAIEHDRVEFRDDVPVLNGRPLERRRLPDACAEKPPCTLWEEVVDGRAYRVAVSTDDHLRLPMDPLAVPADHVFVVGDSRDWSVDSRYFGAVRTEGVVGTATFIFWSSSPRGKTRWSRWLERVQP